MLESAETRQDRRRALIELGVVVGLIELHLWWLSGIDAPLFSLLNLGLIAGMAWRSCRESPIPCPMAAKPSATWVMVALATLLLAAVVTLFAWLCGFWPLDAMTEVGEKSGLEWAVRKSGTVLVQQLALHLFLVPVCYRLCGKRIPAVMLAAAIFGLIHLPNPLLVLLTVAAGFCWCLLYLSTGRIVPLVCSHLLLAVLAREVLHENLYNMRVGIRAVPLMPYSVAADDGQTLRVKPLTVIGNTAVRRASADNVVLGGWAADPKFALPAEKIWVLVDGRFLEFDSSGIPCPAMLKDYDLPTAVNCGYRVTVPVELLARDPHPRVFASRADRVSELDYPPRFAERLAQRVARFQARTAAESQPQRR